MLGATPLSTGYDAHAVAKHQLSMAQAANAAVNLDLSFDDDMVEDVNESFTQCVPKGTVFGGYGKSSGKANVGRNANVPQMSSSTERHRHCPMGGAARNKSPEPTITYTYDVSKPIEYDPIQLNTYNSDREGQTSHMLPHPSPNPNATSAGDSRPHIGDSLPMDDAERDKILQKHGDKYSASTLTSANVKSLKKLKKRYAPVLITSRRPQRKEST